MLYVTPQAWGAPSHKGLLMTLILRTRALSVVAAFYVAAWATGLMLVWTDGDPRLVGFGLGLMAPGGGLAFYGHWPELAAVLASAALATPRIASARWTHSSTTPGSCPPVRCWMRTTSSRGASSRSTPTRS
jgi:hypothetical protein